MSDDKETTGSLADAACLIDFLENPVQLREALLAQFSGLHSDESHLPTRITASFGHILVPSESSARSSITPPLSGSQELSKVLEWFRRSELERVFVSRFDRLIHRLIYRPSQPASGSILNSLKFELVLNVTNPSAPSKMESDDRSGPPENFPPQNEVTSPFSLVPICVAESSSRLDLMLPNRYVLH
ncbi:hypothetical protein H0H87_003812 [Tephrocybe sp. NHM501043]|nr:hypothetical protein H0H87_003812 [Tephrocybe sp. NHM501043]